MQKNGRKVRGRVVLARSEGKKYLCASSEGDAGYRCSPRKGQQRVYELDHSIFAGLCECGFTFCLGKAKLAAGWESAAWYAGFVVISALSMLLLAKASRTIPIGTAYPVWTGIGAVGTVLVGILVFKEPAGFWRLFFITTLIASIVGLKTLS